MLDLERVDRLLKKQGRWFRRVSKASTVSVGGLVYNVKGARKGEQLEIGYEASDRHLVFRDEAGEEIGRGAIRGCAKESC